MELVNKTCADYTEALASKAAIPGGGSAAALVGALGAALGTMVGNLTVGKKKYIDVEPDILALIEKSETIRAELLRAIDDDATGFEPLSRAYSIPKDEPGRDEIMEKCLRDAAGIPIKIMRLSCQAIDLHRDFASKGSTLAISDAGTGVAFCRAAMYGAALNVMANTKYMKDRKYANQLNTEVYDLIEQYGNIADEVYADVFGRMEQWPNS